MTDAHKSQIERINEISAIARTSWLALLGYLAFIGISLLAVEDADFFVPTRRTDLPLVGVAIPTHAFFLFAPILAAALYVYLHLHLLKLWDAIADAPSRIKGRPLGEHLHPWIANDYALALKGSGALRPRPMRWLANLATRLLVWLAGPLVLFGFWWRSMPAHDEWLTLAIAAALLVTLYAGLTSCWALRARLRFPSLPADPWHTRFRRPTAVAVALLVVVASWLRTEGSIGGAWNFLARTDLEGADLTSGSGSPVSLEASRQDFRTAWCERNGFSPAFCGTLVLDEANATRLKAEQERWCEALEVGQRDACLASLAGLERRFEEAWIEERSWLHTPPVSMTDADLRGMFGFSAKLSGADLARARLSDSNLIQADLRGAYLIQANLDRASLSQAELEGAFLNGTSAEDADFSQADLDGAMLLAGFFDNADFSDARLRFSDLRGAQLEGATLDGAVLDGAVMRRSKLAHATWKGTSLGASLLHEADLRGARNLTQAQLARALGNERTLLPDVPAPDTGEPFYVLSCWVAPPPALHRTVAVAAGPTSSLAGRDQLREALICDAGRQPEKVGTPLSARAPYPDGHPLADRR